MRRVAQERVDPRLGAVVRRQVVVDEQPAEHDADADVGERPEREHPARRVDERGDLGFSCWICVDDRADRLVDERDPDLLLARHPARKYGPSGAGRRLRAPAPGDVGRGGEDEQRRRAAAVSSPARPSRAGSPASTPTIEARPITSAGPAAQVSVAPLPPHPGRRGREDRGSDVASAWSWLRCSASSAGTKTIPPPTPNSPASTPAPKPSTTASTSVVTWRGAARRRRRGRPAKASDEARVRAAAGGPCRRSCRRPPGSPTRSA